jgi:peptide/nickel transport system substrate-binding protein
MADKTHRQNASGLILDRRELMKGAVALGLGFGAFGVLCGPAQAADGPKKGGTLRIGMEGGSAKDSLDSRLFTDSISLNYGYQIWNGLVEIDQNGNAVGELLESWEAKPGAKEWIFNVRRGVTFHSGKTLDADDIIYSINLHRGRTKSAAWDLLNSITKIKKLSPNQIQITLRQGNIDLPYNLADFHILGVPNGFKDFSKPNGTGAYKLVSFEPGVRVVTENTGHYWKANCGNFDSIELQYIPNASSRLEALIAGRVDAINCLEPEGISTLGSTRDVNVVRTRGTGNSYSFVARCDKAPYSNLDTRLALKYGIDRQKIVDIVYRGYATIGNDTMISPSNKYYAKDIPQTVYDPEKAAFHYKKAGSPKLELKASEGAYSGATDAGVLYKNTMRLAGIDLTVTPVPSEGYWFKIWRKAPFSAVYWGNRPTADLQLTQTFVSTAAWNDSHWKRPNFDKLIIAARVETDEAKRTQMYADAQRMIHDDGGMVCYALGDYLDGYSKKVMGAAPHARFDMCGQRIAEKCWFA